MGTLALTGAALATTPASAAPGAEHDHDIGEMVDPYATVVTRSGARTRFVARTVTVSPSAGPDFEMPFRCGETWVGSTRSSHSPSAWSIDFNRSGDTGRPTLASARGVVYRVAKASGYGNYVIVDHGGGYTTLYAHLQSTAVNVGQVVDQGAVVGYVGSSGRVTGPHLHFEQRLNGDYFAPYFHRTRFVYGRSAASQNCPDTPVTGDWDRNGRTDVGLYRPASNGARVYQRLSTGSTSFAFGYAGDVPVMGDWNGNRIDQAGKRSPRSSTFVLRGEDGKTSTANIGGRAQDIPLAGRWSLQSKAGLGYYSFATRAFTVRLPDLTKRTTKLGATGSQPVVGDWDGDRRTDFGSFYPRSGTWRLRTVKAGQVVITSVKYGRAWDIPVTGDWDGDGITDVGIWRPSTGVFSLRTVADRGTPQARQVTRTITYGAARH